MNKKEAIQAMLNGKKVRRKDWHCFSDYIYFDDEDGIFYMNNDYVSTDLNSLDYNDDNWEIFDSSMIKVVDEMVKARKIVELTKQINLESISGIEKVDTDKDEFVFEYLDNLNCGFIIFSTELTKPEIENLTFKDVNVYCQRFTDSYKGEYRCAICIYLRKSTNSLVFISKEKMK